jgi:serine-type anaerobic sulfatase-maturating enzyme
MLQRPATGNQRLTYIVKITNGCNLACAYCIAEPYLDRPDARTLDSQLLGRLVAATARGQDSIQLVLHGGEPLLPGKEYWRGMLACITEAANGRPLRLEVQTNGVLIDEEWVQILKQHRVSVGLSVDGPEDIHDRQRPRVGGRGSFAAIVKASRLLSDGGLRFGAICVVTPEIMERFPDGARLVDFLVSLGIRTFDLKPLLDSRFDYPAYARWMCKTFDAWIARDDPAIRIRPLVDVVLRSIGKQPGTCIATGACSTFLTVMPDGDVHGCDRWVAPGATPLAHLTLDNADDVLSELRRARCSCETFCPRCRSTCPFEHSVWGTSLCVGQEILRSHVDSWVEGLRKTSHLLLLTGGLGRWETRLSEWVTFASLLQEREAPSVPSTEGRQGP